MFELQRIRVLLANMPIVVVNHANYSYLFMDTSLFDVEVIRTAATSPRSKYEGKRVDRNRLTITIMPVVERAVRRPAERIALKDDYQ